MSSNTHSSFSSVDIKSSDQDLPHVDVTSNSETLEGQSNPTLPDVQITVDSPQAGSEVQATGQRPVTTALVHGQWNSRNKLHDDTVKGEKLHVDATSDLNPVEDLNNQTSPDLQSVHSSLAGSQIQDISRPPSVFETVYAGLGQRQNTGSVEDEHDEKYEDCAPDPSLLSIRPFRDLGSESGSQSSPEAITQYRPVFYPHEDEHEDYCVSDFSVSSIPPFRAFASESGSRASLEAITQHTPVFYSDEYEHDGKREDKDRTVRDKMSLYSLLGAKLRTLKRIYDKE